MGGPTREKLGGVIRLYVIFRWVYNTRKILDFSGVVSIELKDGYYFLICLDKTRRYINAEEYKLISVELED